MALQATNIVLQDAPGVFEGIIDRRMNIGVAFVGVRLLTDVDLHSIRQSEMDMDLEEAAGPVMLPRIFHHHATSRNPAKSFLKRRHVPRDPMYNGVSICGSLIAAVPELVLARTSR